MDVTDEAGAPQLPVEPVVIALPGHQGVTNVTFEAGEWVALEGQHLVMPCQKQQVLVAGKDLGPRSECKVQNAKVKMPGGNGGGFTESKLSIYESAEPYPASVGRWTGTSYRNGSLGTGTVLRKWVQSPAATTRPQSGTVPIFGQSPFSESTYVQVLVYPVRYIGAERRIEVCREVKVKVEAQPKAEVRRQNGEGRSAGAVGLFEYVIVTGAGLDTVFQRLADWKTQKGVPAVVRTMDWVYAHYAGRDQAEQLRNYLKTLPDSGARYVLLGGDVNVVPFRKAFAMASEWGADPREDSLPCDLYFADLQGSWDANNNNVFGEVADSVDLYADLTVGRAPVNNVAQAQTFVRKVLGYELAENEARKWGQSPGALASDSARYSPHFHVTGYQDKGLFFAEVLWQNPYTDMGVHKNKMERQSFASGYNLTKLYQSLGNETREAVMQAMRESQNFMNHDGHGWIDVMQCGGSANRMRTADADTITNPGLGVLYSIGCWTTAFDYASIGEAFVTNPNGGTVATVGNSSYGWGSPGNPGFGYSDKFDSRFWQAITGKGIYRVGDALAAAKEYYAPFSHEENVYRWHQYDVNLMGDPEMPVWTALPERPVVVGPTAVAIGSGRYLYSVSHAGAPVAGALVCLAKPGEVYSRGLTDDAGQVWLDAAPQTPGRLDLTVTARNFVPYTAGVGCDSGDYVNFAGWRVDDNAGNNDGIANPGETLALPFVLQNTSTDTSCGSVMKLITSDPRVTILGDAAYAPPINPGDSFPVDSGLRVAVAPDARDGAVTFTLFVLGGCAVRWYFPVLQIGEPLLALDRTWLHRTLIPGATSGLSMRLDNRGHGYGHSTWCRLVSLDSFVSVEKESASFGEVLPRSFGTGDSFAVAASSSCPVGHVAMMELQVNADGYAGRDTFELLVGESGFADNMESGEAKWTHGGSGDLWHRTSYRAHSGSYAWYCGDESSRLYNSNMDARLVTVPFAAPLGCTLRFWRWFATPNYGVDGTRVIVMRGGVEDTLDFLGTGGALRENGDCTGLRPRPRGRGLSPLSPGLSATRTLDRLTTRPLLNESGWAEETYDLSWLPLGEVIQVRFEFVSDGDTVDEGFYIDDVCVTGGGPHGVAGVQAAPGLFPSLDVWPNPFRSLAQIRYGGSGELPRLSIYNAAGRIVRRLPASQVATWDGRDDHGRGLPAGTYFIEARTQSERRLAKVLLTR
jgi:hypothetical protein